MASSLVGECDLIEDPILHERRYECSVASVFDDWSQLFQLLLVHLERFRTRNAVSMSHKFARISCSIIKYFVLNNSKAYLPISLQDFERRL